MRRIVTSIVVMFILGLAFLAGLYFVTVTPPRPAPSSHSVTSSTSTMQCNSSDWTTYHFDNSRNGSIPACTPSNANPSWKSASLDGKIYAEPLVFEGKVFVVTENNSAYSLDVSTGNVVWRSHLGDPVPRSALPCGDIDPTGITGTPVIDSSSKILYALAFEMPGKHNLVALNIGDGSVRFTRPADPTGADPLVQQQRGALSLMNGVVYVPFGGLFGDCGNYHGWVVGIKADGSGNLISYQVPTGREGGIWAPSGGAIDASGNLFFTSGNGASSNTFDYGNSVIELSPTLQQLGYFAPTNWLQLNNGDTDLGSVGPLLLSNGKLFQIGKGGVGYILDTNNLGGIGGQLYSANVCSSAFGGSAATGETILVPCTDGLFALTVSGDSFSTSWKSADYPAGPPVVTGGVVWTVDSASGKLEGLDLQSGRVIFSFNVGPVTRFATPSFGDGRLFIASGDYLVAFSLS